MTRHEREQNRAGIEFIIQFNKFVNFDRMYDNGTRSYTFAGFVYGIITIVQENRIKIRELFDILEQARQQFIVGSIV